MPIYSLMMFKASIWDGKPARTMDGPNPKEVAEAYYGKPLSHRGAVGQMVAEVRLAGNPSEKHYFYDLDS